MTSQFIPAFIRRTVRSVLTPAVLDFWAAELGSDQRIDRVMARVVARWMETPDTVTLVLKPNANFQGFAAGQHVNLTVEIDGVRHTRSYSFSEAPAPTGLIAITVKQVPNGRVSSHLVQQVRVGDVLELGQAFGDMTVAQTLPMLQTGERPGLLFLAAGSGVTPLMSLLRQLANDGMPADVAFVYWARTPQDLIFDAELRSLAAQHDALRYLPVVESGAAEGAPSGRPCAEHLQAAVADLTGQHVFVCGPTGFMNAVRGLCGDTVAAFHAESFSPPVFVPSTDDAATVTLTLSRSQRSLTVPAGMPLLDALEAQGVKPRAGCRMGICNTCACGKSGGVARNLLNQDVSVDDTASLRICVSAAVTDLTLDL